jgi:predicted ribosome quality control (RQC) complex YloA/Tae2 family protein
MIRNYFFLNRFLVEIYPLLVGSKFSEAFSQDKDKLILAFKKSANYLFLEISTNPGTPYILLKESFHRAKRNTIDFFPDIINSEVTGLAIARNDRLIRISLKDADIYFAIRGKYTNVLVIDKENRIETFKKFDQEYSRSFIKEVENQVFTEQINHPEIYVDGEGEYIDLVRQKYPFLGKEIFTEFHRRTVANKTAQEILSEIIRDVIINDAEVILNNRTFKVQLLPAGFQIEYADESKRFKNINEAFNYFIQKLYQNEDLRNKFKIVDRYLNKELSRLSTKLNKIKVQLDRGSREEEFNQKGNLLLININSIYKGMNEIELDDIYKENKKIKIKLDTILSPEQNYKRYFERARNDKIGLMKSKEIFSDSEKKYFLFKSLKDKLDTIPSAQELGEIMKELKIKHQETADTKEELSQKFKHYVINQKYHVFVGKDSKNNDLLTTRFAKQNDLWFHARSVSGSHVVLRIDSSKEIIPKDVLKKTASLAAFHSKAKTAGVVPVSYCFKKYVVKKKGMPIGQVALLREDTLLVKPEIPKECEYIQ